MEFHIDVMLFLNFTYEYIKNHVQLVNLDIECVRLAIKLN